MSNIIEDIRPVHVGDSGFIADNEDIFTGSPATDVVSLKNANGIIFQIACNANVGSGAATITIEACDDVTPSHTAAVAFTYKTTSAADADGAVTAATSSGISVGTADTITTIYVSAATIAATAVNSTYGNQYVRLKATETQSDAVDGAITAMLCGLRYSPLAATQLA
jgi:hypothetical protein